MYIIYKYYILLPAIAVNKARQFFSSRRTQNMAPAELPRNRIWSQVRCLRQLQRCASNGFRDQSRQVSRDGWDGAGMRDVLSSHLHHGFMDRISDDFWMQCCFFVWILFWFLLSYWECFFSHTSSLEWGKREPWLVGVWHISRLRCLCFRLFSVQRWRMLLFSKHFQSMFHVVNKGNHPPVSDGLRLVTYTIIYLAMDNDPFIDDFPS